MNNFLTDTNRFVNKALKLTSISPGLADIDNDLFTKLEMDLKDESKFKEEILSRMEKEVLSQEKDLTKESCLLYTSPSPRDATLSRMPSSA